MCHNLPGPHAWHLVLLSFDALCITSSLGCFKVKTLEGNADLTMLISLFIIYYVNSCCVWRIIRTPRNSKNQNIVQTVDSWNVNKKVNMVSGHLVPYYPGNNLGLLQFFSPKSQLIFRVFCFFTTVISKNSLLISKVDLFPGSGYSQDNMVSISIGRYQKYSYQLFTTDH